MKNRFSSPVVMENNFKMKKAKGVVGEVVTSSSYKPNN